MVGAEMRAGMLALCGVLLAGCVQQERVLRHPQTGQAYRCEAVGFGWLGAPLALISYDQCVTRMEEQGFR